MAISLAKLDAKRGEQRRLLAALQADRQKALEALDAKEVEIEGIQQKIQALNAGGENASDDAKKESEELNKQLAAANTEFRKIRSQVVSLADKISHANTKLDELNEDYQIREQHNRFEQSLSTSDRGQSGVGHDGGSTGRGPGADGDDDASGISGERIRVKPLDAETIDYDLGCYFQATVISQLDHVPIHIVAKDFLHNDRVAIAAAQSANDFTRGGAWIQGVYMDRFVELLRPASIVRAAGLESVPLDDGTLTLPEETAGPSGAYLGEGETADTEEVRTGQIRLIAKELVVQIVSSEKLLRSPSARAAERFRRSMIRGAGQTEDLYFIRGSASGAGPTGLRYQAHADNIIAVNATVNLANITQDLGKAELGLLDGNVDMEGAFWIMAPRTLVYLMDLRDGNGNLAWPSLSAAEPRLRNKRVFTTTQIPINLGGSTNESEILLVQPMHNVIGDAPRVEFQSSNVAAYNNGGTTTAAFSNRQVVSRLVMENDLKTLQSKSIAVLTEVDWGA